MKFQVCQFADINFDQLEHADVLLMTAVSANVPWFIAMEKDYDDTNAGVMWYVPFSTYPNFEDLRVELKQFNYSDSFCAIFKELHAQKIDYVFFRSTGYPLM